MISFARFEDLPASSSIGKKPPPDLAPFRPALIILTSKGDETIREIDHLMAEAIRIITALYDQGLLEKDPDGEYFPDLLAFHDSPTAIEQRLFVMFLEHRMRAFQGVFHNNPDYALWYGWSEMVRDLTSIREMAADLGLVLD